MKIKKLNMHALTIYILLQIDQHYFFDLETLLIKTIKQSTR